MAEWVRLGEFESPLQALVREMAESDAYAGVVSGIRTAQEGIELVANVLGVLSILHQTGDPASSVLRALSAQLDELLRDVLNTGVGFFPILPKTPAGLLHPFPTSSAMLEAAFQASDHLDSDRPQGGPSSAYAGIVFLVGANRWLDFRRLLNILDALFGSGRTQWGALARLQLKVRDKSTIARDFRSSSGAAWDWTKLNLFEIPFMQEAFGPILALLERLSAVAEGLGQVVQDVADILSERIEHILGLLDSLNQILEFFTLLESFMTEAYLLPFASATGGVAGATNDWINSSNEPDLALVAGFILMAEGPNAAQSVRNFMDVFGMQDERIRNAIDKATSPPPEGA